MLWVLGEVYVGQEDRIAIQDAVKKPRNKWRRRALWGLVIVPLGMVAGVLVIGQTSLMQVIAEPILEDQLGIDVESGSIHLMPTGEIVITDGICKTGTIDTLAGSLIEFDRAMIYMNWWGVVRGSGQVRSMVIDKPLVRVSQDIDTGVLNLAAMKFKKGDGGGATPAIEIRNGVLQIGEHDQGSYQVLKELSIKGRLTKQTDQGISAFEFEALPTEQSMLGTGALAGSVGSFGLTGQISEDGIFGVLNGVRLEDWPADIVPSRSRGMYDRLGLAGDLAPTRFSVSPDGLAEVVLTLEGVALNLPFDVAGSISGSIEDGELLRMRQTRGTIRFGTSGLVADLNGVIDGLGYTVDLDFQGLEASSPFEATLVTDFRLDEHFKPIRFLPDKVMSKLDRFENPEADIHAVVQIARRLGSDIQVAGKAELSNGSAIYKKFRYPFYDMSGVIEFDPDKLVVRDIVGAGPTGATLVANGLFSPLGEQSVVKLELAVEGVGFDEHLMAAMSAKQRKLVGALFSEERYARLVDERLVLTQDDADGLAQLRRQTVDQMGLLADDGGQGVLDRRAELAGEIAAIDRALEVPVFEFGGAANVDVMLVRHPERPADDRWTTDVRVRLPESGLVPDHFPIPIMASGVEILLTDERIELAGGEYRGLGGGSASVEVKMDRTVDHAKPTIEIVARDFPIDDRLISAIPGYYDGANDDPDDLSLRRILDRLRLSGQMDCEAIIGPRSNGILGYDVEATVFDGIARPERLSGVNEIGSDALGTVGLDPLTLDDVFGTIYVTEELIVVDIDGMLSSPGLPLAPSPIQVLTQLTMPSATQNVDAFGPRVAGPLLYASAYGDGIDLAMPLEHAIAVVSPRIARELFEKKLELNPEGVLGLDAELEGYVGGAIETKMTLNRVDQVEFDFDQTRYQVGSSWGRAEITLASEPVVEFDGFRVSIKADGHDAGVLSLDGKLPLARGGRRVDVYKTSELAIGFEGGTFESPITRGVINKILLGDGDTNDADESWFASSELGGRFDLDVVVSPKIGLHKIHGEADKIGMVPMEIYGSLSPKSLRLQMGDRLAVFEQISGEVRFDGFEGRFDKVTAISMPTAGSDSQQTTIEIDGGWAMEPGRGLSLDLQARADGDLLDGPTRALLPRAVDRVIDGLEIRSPGKVLVDDLRINASELGTEHAEFDITGVAAINGGRAMVGLEMTEIVGDIGFSVHGVDELLGYEITLDAQRLRAGSMRVHDARVTIIGDAHNSGVVLIPEISASMHGGQIAGSAQIRPGTDGEQHYWMELHASGVRVAPMFEDLLLPPEGLVGPPRPGQTQVLSSWSLGEDLSRGAMIGDLTLTGPIGDPTKRSGRGLVRVDGGSVVALPGLIQLVEVSNLSLPAGSPLDVAEADFYIDGQTMAFEQLNASSKRIEILGYGTMDLESREVDLRFRSRSVNPIPVISDLIERLRDELITTRVTGVISDPSYSMQQFGSTKRLIGAMLGRPETDHQQRLREVEDQVQASQARSQRRSLGQQGGVHQPMGTQVDWAWGLWESEDEGEE